ncbi:class I SAM-dependent methyltransferase [Hyphococcus sp.]|uniref:class I SAM-dependent methyltransferase n=1 Tax=Hyphococcus sp. TaxID=2038636 RepID=UPI003CCBF285
MLQKLKSMARDVRDNARVRAMRGDDFECCSCGAQLKKFLAQGAKFRIFDEKQIIGSGYRENNCCPVCWSTDRERLALKYVEWANGFLAEYCAILHVAPEPSIARYLGAHPKINYVRSDYLRPSMSVALDIQILPFQDEVFDLVICNHVLEHVDDDRKSMRELRRVLRPGATAMLQVPLAIDESETHEDKSITDGKARERHFGQDDHVRLYGRDYADRIKAAGFALELVDWKMRPDIFGADAERYGFNPEELLYIAKKI